MPRTWVKFATRSIARTSAAVRKWTPYFPEVA
jgi:hypothetical protein